MRFFKFWPHFLDQTDKQHRQIRQQRVIFQYSQTRSRPIGWPINVRLIIEQRC